MKRRALAFKSFWPTLGAATLAVTLVFAGSLSSARIGAPPPPKPVSKADVLTRLKGIQERENIELQSVDDAVAKRLRETTQISLKSMSGPVGDRKINQVIGQIEDLTSRHTEFAARRQFLNDLIFAVDTKWNDQQLNVFLEHQFLDMALNALGDTKPDQHNWKFYIYMSVAVREVPEAHEDVLNVLESYLNYSGVTDPKSPALFLASRSYSNGSLTYTARPVSPSKVGDLVDKQIAAIEKSGVPPVRRGKQAPADIELRIAPIPPPSASSRNVRDDHGTISGSTLPSDESSRSASKTAPQAPTTDRPSQKIIPDIRATDGASVPPSPPAVPNENH